MVMTMESTYTSEGLDIPEFDSQVTTSRSQILFIERDIVDTLRMTFESLFQLATVIVPDFDSTVFTATGHQIVVPMNRQTLNHSSMRLQHMSTLATHEHLRHVLVLVHYSSTCAFLFHFIIQLL